jgi:hypothetical protein
LIGVGGIVIVVEEVVRIVPSTTFQDEKVPDPVVPLRLTA